MSDEKSLKRHEGGLHQGPAHASPYPMSRLAPVHDLVDVAREIQRADSMLGAVVNNKMKLIAEQIRRLQEDARGILEAAERDGELHRVRCNFSKAPGQTYHLYRRPDGERYFSMLSPDDWAGAPPHAFEGSYRLELDMSWSPVGEAESGEMVGSVVGRLSAPTADTGWFPEASATWRPAGRPARRGSARAPTSTTSTTSTTRSEPGRAGLLLRCYLMERAPHLGGGLGRLTPPSSSGGPAAARRRR